MLTFLLQFISDNWLLQSIFCDSVFTLICLLFGNRYIHKIIKNRKKERIENAKKELITYIMHGLIDWGKINIDDLRSQLSYILTKYKLDISDIHIDDNQFYYELENLVLNAEFIQAHFKKCLIRKIRAKEIFVNINAPDPIYIKNLSEYLNDISINGISDNNTQNHKNNSDYKYSGNDSDNEKNILIKEILEENINFSNTEKKNINKYITLFTGIIFVITFIFISVIKVLFNYFQNNTIFFVNTIIILVLLLPVLINGIMYYEDFNNHSKRNFLLLLVGYVLVFINFICIIGNML